MNSPYKRLIAFGDSFTFGHGLDDIFGHGQTKGPSNFAWPALLGKALNIPVINNGKPGASNLEILTKILDFKFKQGDLVIVGWTFVDRSAIFKKTFFKKDVIRLHSNGTDEASVSYFNTHDFYDLSVRSGLNIHHACLYLDTLPVTHRHFSAAWKNVPEFLNTPFPIYFKKPTATIHLNLFPRLDKAPDNDHPGIKSQEKLTENLRGII